MKMNQLYRFLMLAAVGVMIILSACEKDESAVSMNDNDDALVLKS